MGTEGAILGIIRSYTRGAGVRNLERELGAICRGVARRIAKGEMETVAVGQENLAEFLGPLRFRWELAEKEDEVGGATGRAGTPAGGGGEGGGGGGAPGAGSHAGRGRRPVRRGRYRPRQGTPHSHRQAGRG